MISTASTVSGCLEPWFLLQDITTPGIQVRLTQDVNRVKTVQDSLLYVFDIDSPLHVRGNSL
jgi:hypothetical protein